MTINRAFQISAPSVLTLRAALLVLLLFPGTSLAERTPIKIGVLAHVEESMNMWAPTAAYLTNAIPEYSFGIVPLDNNTIGPTVERGGVDFVITNPGSYIDLESRYGVTRVLTLRNLRQGKPYTQFGAVLFTRDDRGDIQELKDIKGKSFMAVDKNAFGGFLMGWLEFKKLGIDPFRHFSELKFAGLPQEKIVQAVLKGEVDAGMVRTDTLERMADAGKIDIKQIRVLNRQQAAGFPFALSTRLYPEWPFAKVKHTPEALAQKTAVALLSMPLDHPAAKASKSAGWTVPLDYTPVHELYKELRVGPYQDYGNVTLADVLKLYWHWLAVVLGVILLLGMNTGYILRLNRGLKQSQTRLLEVTHQLEQLAILDGLTGIYNHRHFQESLSNEWRRAQRNKKPVSLIMIDIDFFKNFNDSYGHPIGDECLKAVARAIKQSVNRPGDLVARYGGEEFVAILPEAALEGAALIAERMRAAVEELKFPHRYSRIADHVTVSLGVASFVPARESSPDMLITAADKALYAAKEAGRNRMQIAKAA